MTQRPASIKGQFLQIKHQQEVEFSTLVPFLCSKMSLSEEFGYFCIRKMVFEKSICGILGVGGFNSCLFWIYMAFIPFYVVVVLHTSVYDFLFKSTLGHCQ